MISTYDLRWLWGEGGEGEGERRGLLAQWSCIRHISYGRLHELENIVIYTSKLITGVYVDVWFPKKINSRFLDGRRQAFRRPTVTVQRARSLQEYSYVREYCEYSNALHIYCKSHWYRFKWNVSSFYRLKKTHYLAITNSILKRAPLYFWANLHP